MDERFNVSGGFPTTSQGSGINSFNIKPGPRLRQYLHSTSRFQTTMVYICPRCDCQQLESCAAQLCNAPAWWCGAFALGCCAGWSGLRLACLGPRTAFSSVPLLYVFGIFCDISLALPVFVANTVALFKKPYSLGKSDGLLFE